MSQFPIHKILIISGLLLLLSGIIWYFFSDKFSWLGKLPGDFKFENENSKIYFPLTTMLLISLVINAVVWLIKKFL